LAAGAALILRGTVARDTNDLDVFIGHADAESDTIATMVAAVERALSGAGIEWRREVTTDTFARLTVETEHEECRIDLAVDVRMRPVDRDPRVALLSLEELAADKVLAMFGRAAARDFQDVGRCAGTSAGRSCSSSRARRTPASPSSVSWTRSPPSTGSMRMTSISRGGRTGAAERGRCLAPADPQWSMSPRW
jgi:hypothetical protein